MPNDEVVADLRARLQRKDDELAHLHGELRDARMVGIAIGVLLARTPGWTEQDALDAWNGARTDLTRDGNTQALASYVVQTGMLPGQGVAAPASGTSTSPRRHGDRPRVKMDG